jgi:hypothetical protein
LAADLLPATTTQASNAYHEPYALQACCLAGRVPVAIIRILGIARHTGMGFPFLIDERMRIHKEVSEFIVSRGHFGVKMNFYVVLISSKIGLCTNKKKLLNQGAVALARSYLSVRSLAYHRCPLARAGIRSSFRRGPVDSGLVCLTNCAVRCFAIGAFFIMFRNNSDRLIAGFTTSAIPHQCHFGEHSRRLAETTCHLPRRGEEATAVLLFWSFDVS